MPLGRPPPVDVDHEHVRRDVHSLDMQRVHPEVGAMGDADERNAHLRRCDDDAYKTIRVRFPKFTPPGTGLSATEGRTLAES